MTQRAQQRSPSANHGPKLFGRRIDLLILDLDGVLTRTARIHAAAWKQVFDEFLATRGLSAQPFDATDEYRRYVDGKPRYDGVASFLDARNIALPYGAPEDSPGDQTICALGNMKNEVFQRLLEEQGVDVFDDAVRLVRHARRKGLKTAVISSSKNCKPILDAADLAALFDAVVDGVEADVLGLKGKPAPDIFLEAAKRLGVRPQYAGIIEDALAGVEAGKAGGFSLVIGVDRSGQAEALQRSGADAVVSTLDELSFDEGDWQPSPVYALDALDEIKRSIGMQPVAFFLDYDGTLTPIVEHPEQAILSDQMRTLLDALRSVATVTIVSGRSVEDVRRLVGLERLVYAGAHGFDILDTREGRITHQVGSDAVPILEEAEQELRRALASIPGAQVEGKKYAVAAHYRRVADEDVDRVKRAVEAATTRYPQLMMTGGKKVFELRPNVPWDKGKAVLWIYRALGLAGTGAIPIYIGDDETDYDAFEALKDLGIGILVAERPPPSAARYFLRDVKDVGNFLGAISAALSKRP